MLEVTFGFVKPHAYHSRNEIAGVVGASGLVILQTKDPYLIAREVAEEFYREHRGKDFYEALVESITAGPSCLFVIGGDNAVVRLSELAGPTDPKYAFL